MGKKSAYRAAGILIACVAFLMAARAFAHCDTMNGPVIPEAQDALEKGDVTPILKWVRKDNEAEIKAAFEKAVAIRSTGPEAMALADRYFLETLVRVHRAGEGAPYTGLKDEPVEAIVQMTDKALADGSADELISEISSHMAAAIKQKFTAVLEAQEHKDESVEAGRKYVEAYVTYTHYVEGIHEAILATGGHQHEGGGGHDTPPNSAHEEHSH